MKELVNHIPSLTKNVWKVFHANYLFENSIFRKIRKESVSKSNRFKLGKIQFFVEVRDSIPSPDGVRSHVGHCKIREPEDLCECLYLGSILALATKLVPEMCKHFLSGLLAKEWEIRPPDEHLCDHAFYGARLFLDVFWMRGSKLLGRRER